MRVAAQASDGVQCVEQTDDERVRVLAGSRRELCLLGQVQPLNHFTLQTLEVCLADDAHPRAVRNHVASHLLAVDADHAVRPVRVNVNAASTLRTLIDVCHPNTSLVYCNETRNGFTCSELMNIYVVSNSIQKSP